MSAKMSWKRCWNGGYSHGFYESEDDQIVPDIDRRTSSSSSSSLSSASSATSVDASAASSIRPGIDTHQQASSSSHATMYRPVASSAASSYRAFPSKRDHNGNADGGIFGQQRAIEAERSLPTGEHRSAHYRVYGLKTTPPFSASSTASTPTLTPFSWSNKSPHESNDYYGSSRTGEKRHALELNDFWEEKYSRIAVITTTTNHFGQPMVKF